MRIVSVLLLAVCLCGSTSANARDEIRDSVVKIHATQRLPDFARPWTKSPPVQASGSGVVIEGKRILTNAHVVQYASQIFVQGNQSTEKVPAEVVASAPEVDLALLELKDESFFNERPALPLATQLPDIRDSVNVYGYPIGGEQLSVTEGIVSRIEYASFYYGIAGLRIQVDAALNAGNSGGPAVADGKIVGLVFSKIRQADNIGYLIAGEEIAMFLEDIADGNYDGKPWMYDQFQTTENVALRAKLDLQDVDGGIMVRFPYSQDEDYPLKEWDVITHIGEHAIDNRGAVVIKDDLRLGFHYFIPKLAAEGTVPLSIIRNSKSLKVRAPVTTKSNILVPFLRGTYPRHFICGPMVFTTATQDLVARLGLVPQALLRTLQSPLLSRQYDEPAFEGEELVVLGPRLFPHQLTKGYGGCAFAVVREVNNTPVRNLAHLVELLRDAEGEYLVFKFHGRYETLVFPREEFMASTEEILDAEGIRYQYSEDLAEIWER